MKIMHKIKIMIIMKILLKEKKQNKQTSEYNNNQYNTYM